MSCLPRNPLRIGVIGLGRRGLFHLERWRDGGVTAVGCDRDAAARSVAAGLCRRVFETPEELPSDELDALLLAVPTAARPELAAFALKAGLHVLLDPPIAPNLASTRAMFTEATAWGRRVIAVPPGRAEPDFLAAAGVLASGQIGEPRLFRFERWTATVGGTAEPLGADGPTVPRAVVTLLDQLVALADGPAESVFASPLGTAGLSAVVTFADGRRGLVTLHGVASLRLESGWAIDADAGGYAAGRRWVRAADGERYDLPAEPLEPPPTPEEELRRVLAGGEPTVSPADSLRLVALLDAVGRSLASGSVVAVEA